MSLCKCNRDVNHPNGHMWMKERHRYKQKKGQFISRLKCWNCLAEWDIPSKFVGKLVNWHWSKYW